MISGLLGGSRRPFQGGQRSKDYFYNNTKTFCSIHFVNICTNTKATVDKTAGALTQINEVIFFTLKHLCFNKKANFT